MKTKSLLRGGASSLAIKIAAAVTSFLVNFALAKLLGVEDAGLYFLGITIVSIATVLSGFGLNPVLTRFIARYSSIKDWVSLNGIFRNSLVIVLFSSTISLLLIYVYRFPLAAHVFDKPGLAPLLSKIVFAIPALALLLVVAHAFQGRHMIKRYLIFQNFGVSLIFLLSISVFYFYKIYLNNEMDFTVDAAGGLYVAAAVSILFIALFSWTNVPGVKILSGGYSNRELLVHSAPLYGIATLGLISQFSAQISLGVYAENEDIAIFTISLRTAALLALVLTAVNGVVFPRYAAMFHSGDLKGLRATALLSTRIMIAICLPLFLCILIFAEDILALFGEEFRGGKTTLQVLAISQFFNVATGSVGGLLTMTGHAKYAFCSSVLAAATVAFLCVLLIPKYGTLGAAFAQAIAQSLQMILNTIAVKSTIGFVPLNVFRKIT